MPCKPKKMPRISCLLTIPLVFATELLSCESLSAMILSTSGREWAYPALNLGGCPSSHPVFSKDNTIHPDLTRAFTFTPTNTDVSYGATFTYLMTANYSMGVWVGTYTNPVVLTVSSMTFYPALSTPRSIFPLKRLAETDQYILLDWEFCFEVGAAYQNPSNVGGVCEHFPAFVVDKANDQILPASFVGGVYADFLSTRVTQADGTIRKVGNACGEPEATSTEYGCVVTGGTYCKAILSE